MQERISRQNTSICHLSRVYSGETVDMHRLRLTMRIMVFCSPTLLSLSWFVLCLPGGALGGVGTGGTGPRGDVVVHAMPRNIPVDKRFYDPDVTYYSQLLKNSRPADLDFVDFILGDERKRAKERGHDHHHHQPWNPLQVDYVDFLIGNEMGSGSEWKQPVYQRTVPDDLEARRVLTMRGPQTVKFRPFYSPYEEILRRRKRSKGNSLPRKNQKNDKGTGIKDGQSGKSAIANSMSREGQSQSYSSTRGVPTPPPSLDSTAPLDEISAATCKPQQPGTNLIKSSGGMEKREENGERFRFPFNQEDRPSYEEFILGEKRPIQYQTNDYYQRNHAAVKPPPHEMTYDEFLLGEKRKVQQQQQQPQSSAIDGQFQFNNKDKSFLQKPA